jgi:hypothetical protein
MRLLRVGEAAVLAGCGGAAALPGADAGRVVAVFSRAVYLSLPGGMIALVGPDAEPGPLHAHVTRLPAVAVGDPVWTAGGRLYISGRPVPGRPDTWRPPPLPDPGRADAIARTLHRVLDHEPQLDLAESDALAPLARAPGPKEAPPSLVPPVAALPALLSPGDAGPGAEPDALAPLAAGRWTLDGAAAALAGRGAGLTPAGDDVLAGLFLVARMRLGRPAEPRLVALAGRCRTHDISRAFLVEAARGRSVAALHDLIGAGADGDLAAARRARTRLARVGHTSGLDLAYGVLAGCAAAAARGRGYP